jgi:hypothetical protein
MEYRSKLQGGVIVGGRGIIMRRYYTHYWTNDTWRREARRADPKAKNKKKREWGLLNHTAGNVFKRRGVKSGDVVYVITIMDGELIVGGKIIVDKILNQSQAGLYLGQPAEKLWEAADHLVMPIRQAEYFNPKNKVPFSVSSRLGILNSSGTRFPKCIEKKLDSQTMRGVCELSHSASQALDKYI